ncbi:MAG: FtsW/RodA/SpoVE family cell cycle protein [Bacteroidetes bacterium]|nr:FtsW/RodA/SpoVE family cell cycle protein [Bacteroidota bacterium]MBU1372055.1 FtsW/RodA/SpoVE family cell cycle protein [Bacteroidota bacterium]MBU1483657.1 FtsW/RodA/SpoVE family cell cycle protein [Bacteroidota bacterium]MBU1760786.1 FtsW/RodA/SpoVE family cell cycle protein [Bacteroidota bacterium]MBU2047121.1 FtsW/RodA/SpoVE family cell cycle protein [Bacteroidota bacterium]
MIKAILNQTKGDRWIWLIIILLSLISVLAVYSATGTLAYKRGVGSESLMFKHLLFIVLGFVLIYFAHLLNYRYYAGISKILMFITIPLLLYTLLFGSHVNDASRWIAIPGTGLTFQTSDLAKLALITYLARTLTKQQTNIKDFKSTVIWLLAPMGAVFILIALANLSTAVMLAGVGVLILLIGRVSFSQMSIVGAGLGILLVIVLFLGPRRGVYINRVKAYMHPEMQSSDRTFQQDQAKIAVATGGILGKGPGNSTQRNFLPHPYSDFIFAIIIEEYGLVGGCLMVFLYLILMYRIIKIVAQAPKAFGALLAAGLGFSLTIQALANMAVAVNLFPVTGVPLPLVSMGGTSILFTSIALGIILSVSKDVEEYKTETKEGKAEKVIIGEIPTLA